MKFTAYVVEKNGKFWSRTQARFIDSPDDGCTFSSPEIAQALADTSGVEAEKSSKVVHQKTGRVYNVGRDIEASPPGVVRKVTITVET